MHMHSRERERCRSLKYPLSFDRKRKMKGALEQYEDLVPRLMSQTCDNKKVDLIERVLAV